MAARKPEDCRGIPRSLLTLHEKASGTSLDGEGIQAWVEWEMEAMHLGVPIEISRDDLEVLVNPSEVKPKEEHQLLHENARSEPEMVGEARTVLKPPEIVSNSGFQCS